ncbi:MAG: tripartite tricarboxylate transporter substrate binding protein, partial [bacterium]
MIAMPVAFAAAAAMLAVLAVPIMAVPSAQAQSVGPGYPAKPLRLIIPFPAGGGADIFARLIGRRIQENTGQAVLADNRAGASGII